MDLFYRLSNIDTNGEIPERRMIQDITSHINESGYVLAELNADKPWGVYFRFHRDDTDKFVDEFFSSVDISKDLMNEGGNLSAKVLLVSPGQGLSWQYHRRRSEVWNFLTEGGHKRSMTNKESDLIHSHSGHIIQFQPMERHRLVGHPERYTLVAEVWQHSHPDNLSDEKDIVRLIDDYSRVSKKLLLREKLIDLKSKSIDVLRPRKSL